MFLTQTPLSKTNSKQAKLSKFKLTALSGLLAMSLVACATTEPNQAKALINSVDINAVSAQGVGEKIGKIQLEDSPQGLVLKTDLSQLPPGFHGFHIHEKGSCESAEKDGKMVAALAAGGHFNPHQVAGHGSPNDGHLGDLPVLNVDSNGLAKTTVVAPRLKLADIKGLAIMIHAGGDNYSDTPKPLGGGGDRIACGVIS